MQDLVWCIEVRHYANEPSNNIDLAARTHAVNMLVQLQRHEEKSVLDQFAVANMGRHRYFQALNRWFGVDQDFSVIQSYHLNRFTPCHP